MQPSEVRERVLRDHESLRQRAVEVERLAREVLDNDRVPAGKLRQTAAALLEALETHMGWEDRYLVPALLDADAWGPDRVARFDREHVEQREEIRELLENLADPRESAAPLAGRVLDWLEALSADMEEEEEAFLGIDLLRDDVVGIDVEAG